MTTSQEVFEIFKEGVSAALDAVKEARAAYEAVIADKAQPQIVRDVTKQRIITVDGLIKRISELL